MHAVEHLAQLLQPHRIAVAIRDDHRAESRRVLKLAGRLHGERLVFAVEDAGRLVYVALCNRLLNLVNTETIGRQLVWIHLDAHGVLLRAVNRDLGDTVYHRNLLRQQVLGVVVHARKRQRRRRHGDVKDRRIGRVDLVVSRW